MSAALREPSLKFRDHARRHIYDVHELTPTPDTGKLLDMIGELYSIEADIRGKPPDKRLRVRQEKSQPLLNTFESTIRAKLATLPKKSTLTGGINYSLNHWAALTFYCEHRRADISNVLAENALRCVALGRKTTCSSPPTAAVSVRRRCTVSSGRAYAIVALRY